jgi:hypothetical protein
MFKLILNDRYNPPVMLFWYFYLTFRPGGVNRSLTVLRHNLFLKLKRMQTHTAEAADARLINQLTNKQIHTEIMYFE